MPKTRHAAADFRSAARDTRSQEVPVKRVRTVVTGKHVDQSHFRRFHDPVSTALRSLLNDDTAVCVHWQSDGWRPRYHDDEADIHLYLEVHDDAGAYIGELHYQTRLPRNMERAMKRLAGITAGPFEDTAMVIDIPVVMARVS